MDVLIRLCICDDKTKDLQTVERCAGLFSTAHPEFPLRTDTFSRPHDLLQALEENGGYDLYMLDVMMPRLNGIELAKKIRERGERAEILFLTVSREYALEAFGVQAAGYLLKPVEQKAFDGEVLRCLQNLAPRENPCLLLKTRDGLRKIQVRKLVAVESFNHSRVCTMADGTVLETPATLSSLQEQLRAYPWFFAPHRAYIVNLEYVCGLTATELQTADGKRIPVSRKIYPKLKEAYMNLYFD